MGPWKGIWGHEEPEPGSQWLRRPQHRPWVRTLPVQSSATRETCSRAPRGGSGVVFVLFVFFSADFYSVKHLLLLSFPLPSSSIPPKQAASAASDRGSSQRCHRQPVKLKVKVKPVVGLQLSQHICGAGAAAGSPRAKVRWIYGVSYQRY